MLLSRARPIGVGMAAVHLPIPVADAIAMAEAVGWAPLDFLRVIGPADDLYVATKNASA